MSDAIDPTDDPIKRFLLTLIMINVDNDLTVEYECCLCSIREVDFQEAKILINNRENESDGALSRLTRAFVDVLFTFILRLMIA